MAAAAGAVWPDDISPVMNEWSDRIVGSIGRVTVVDAVL